MELADFLGEEVLVEDLVSDEGAPEFSGFG